MPKFEYNNKSTEDVIIETGENFDGSLFYYPIPLMLVVYNGEMGTLGANRSKIEGERTILHPRTNEYGVMYDPLSFTITLIREDNEDFTIKQQRTIERWITSPKFSSELKVTDCDGLTTSYFGLFLTTAWEFGPTGGFDKVTLTFQCQDPYAFKKYSFKNVSDLDYYTSYITIDSDELEECVYPIIRILPREDSENTSFRLTQYTDSNKAIQIKTDKNIPITIDCEHCRVYYSPLVNGEYVESGNIKYKDLGWSDVGTIYWPRLFAGENILLMNGHVDYIIEGYYPYKRVGGWLA